MIRVNCMWYSYQEHMSAFSHPTWSNQAEVAAGAHTGSVSISTISWATNEIIVSADLDGRQVSASFKHLTRGKVSHLPFVWVRFGAKAEVRLMRAVLGAPVAGVVGRV